MELPRGKGAVVNAADFGLNESVENAATLINNALAHCKKIGASKLVLPKGRYKCFDATSIMLEGFEDFTLDGNGSLLVCQSDSVKQMRPQWDKALESGVSNIKIRKCKRVRVANLDFDWDWERDPLAGFAKVVGRNADPENPYVDFQFFQYEKYPTYGRKTPTVVITPYRADLSALAEDAAGVWGGDPAPLGAGEGTSAFPTSGFRLTQSAYISITVKSARRKPPPKGSSSLGKTCRTALSTTTTAKTPSTCSPTAT